MFIEYLLGFANRFPGKIATRDATRSLTYAQLTMFARMIRRLVLRETRCERVGLMLPASTAGMGTVLGVLWAERTVVPLNFLLPSRELIGVVTDAQIDLIISTRHFDSQLTGIPARTLYLEELPLKRMYLMEKLRFTPRIPKVNNDDTAAIIYTSGSTGQPRGVCLSYSNLACNARGAIEHFKLTLDDHLLGMLPPFHIFGFTDTLLVPLMLGGQVTYIPRFSPQAVHRTIKESGITLVMAVPSMYGAVARLKQIASDDFAHLRLAVSGGEPLPRLIYDEFLQRTGVSLLEGYGLTEASPVVSANQPWACRVGTVGKPIPGVEIQVRDEIGHPVADGRDGELCVRGPSVMQGYYHRPEETATVIDTDGWLRTGDIVKVDAEGFIAITGRAKDMMIVAGENVFPREVESVLEKHPAVEEAAVLGKTDASRGEVVVAFVKLKQNSAASPDDLRIFCRERLAGYKTPRDIYIVPDLPRGPTGKIAKRELRAQLADNTAGIAAG